MRIFYQTDVEPLQLAMLCYTTYHLQCKPNKSVQFIRIYLKFLEIFFGLYCTDALFGFYWGYFLALTFLSEADSLYTNADFLADFLALTFLSEADSLYTNADF